MRRHALGILAAAVLFGIIALPVLAMVHHAFTEVGGQL